MSFCNESLKTWSLEGTDPLTSGSSVWSTISALSQRFLGYVTPFGQSSPCMLIRILNHLCPLSQVYHKWNCETTHPDTFCMRVHSCFVDDGQGDTVDLIDPNGCGVDKYLLNHLEYATDLMAGQEAHVFKYADRVALFFQCQVR